MLGDYSVVVSECRDAFGLAAGLEIAVFGFEEHRDNSERYDRRRRSYNKIAVVRNCNCSADVLRVGRVQLRNMKDRQKVKK